MENGWKVVHADGSQNVQVDTLLKSKKPFAEMEVTGELSSVNENKKKATIPVTGKTDERETVREEKCVKTIKNETNGNKNPDQIITKFSFVSMKVPYEYDGRIQNDALIDEPMFRLPYELGWKRYILKRKKQTSKLSDAFYIAPDHKKRLRSKRDVRKVLDSLGDNNSLTTNNFTFRNERIVVYGTYKTDTIKPENFEPAT